MWEISVAACRHRQGRREDRSCGKSVQLWPTVAACCQQMGHQVQETVIGNFRTQLQQRATRPTAAEAAFRASQAA